MNREGRLSQASTLQSGCIACQCNREARWVRGTEVRRGWAGGEREGRTLMWGEERDTGRARGGGERQRGWEEQAGT